LTSDVELFGISFDRRRRRSGRLWRRGRSRCGCDFERDGGGSGSERKRANKRGEASVRGGREESEGGREEKRKRTWTDRAAAP